MKKLSFILIGLFGLMVSCTTKTVEGSTGIKTDALAQGKTIYENSCAKCHDLPDPKKYNDEKWVQIMNWMAPKAKITDAQSALVYDYVTSKN